MRKAVQPESLTRAGIALLRAICGPTDDRLTSEEKAALWMVYELVQELDARVKTLTDTCGAAARMLQGTASPDNKVVAINRVLESAFPAAGVRT